MTEASTVHSFSEALTRRFTTTPPLLLSNSRALKFELKPYLQPFERELAMRELRALLGPDTVTLREIHGYYVADTEIPDDVFKRSLTYWQRVGRTLLEPTTQKILEFTQNGVVSAPELHRARRLRYGPHDLHEYRGKFFPQLVRSLITIAQVPERGTVFDPMAGSGTTPCEAIASGRDAVAVDLNPLSVLIARVKSSVALEEPDVFSTTVRRYLDRFDFAPPASLPWPDDDRTYLERWFDPAALFEIAGVLVALRTVRKAFYRDFFLVCLSNILRSASWQKDDDLRVRKEVGVYSPGTILARFREEVGQQLERIYPYLCVLPRSVAPPRLDVIHGDAVGVADLLPGRTMDVLITSPPYATALPYLDTDRLSLIVLGLAHRASHGGLESRMVGTREVTEAKRRALWETYQARCGELPSSVTLLVDRIARSNHGDGVGFRRRNLPALLGAYFLNMLDAMRSAHKVMRPGAFAFYVVGNNSTMVGEEKVTIATDDFLFDVGSLAGWKTVERIPMELLTSRDIFRENRGSSETILVFQA